MDDLKPDTGGSMMLRARIFILFFLFSTSGFAQEIQSDAVPEAAPVTYRLGILTGITVPQPLSVGLLAVPSYDPDLAFFVDGGWFTYSFSGGTRAVGSWGVKAGIRYHPWSDWFFFAPSFGFRNMSVTADISSFQSDGEPLASKARLSANALFFGFTVGGQWWLSSNVAVGMEVGIQLSPFPWGGITIEKDPSVPDDTDLSVDASETMRRIAGLPIPEIALIRFIWYI